jgi:2-oxo-3-hexenedioate decarboxylase
MIPALILRHIDNGTFWPAIPQARRRTDVDAAYQDALALRQLRMARSERPVGYKIGFTNRTIWQRYAVHAPIWGTVWDTGLRHCDGHGVLSLDKTCQPRLEPELAFGIQATPPKGAGLETLFNCVDWLAPSFELVQSHCPDWKFTAAETVADGALHARLLIGRKTPVRALAGSGERLDAMLAATRLRLLRGAALVDEGLGQNVLDGPLHALHHFVEEMYRCPGAPALQPGDVVTTGTWTDAWPPAPGETWRSEMDAPFLPLEVTFSTAIG